jgi:hypothetical protein
MGTFLDVNPYFTLDVSSNIPEYISVAYWVVNKNVSILIIKCLKRKLLVSEISFVIKPLVNVRNDVLQTKYGIKRHWHVLLVKERLVGLQHRYHPLVLLRHLKRPANAIFSVNCLIMMLLSLQMEVLKFV